MVLWVKIWTLGSDCLSLSVIQDESELTNIEKKIEEYSEDITELFNVLMTLEVQLVEQLEVRPGPWVQK